MNINDVSIYSGRIQEKKGSDHGNSFLNLGKRGQIIQGVISGVGEKQVTINFDGTEVSVAKNAVRDAKEGEIRKFQIKEISKDSLVLKEVGRQTETEEVRAQAKTTVAANSYSFEEQLKNASELSKTQTKANEDLSILNGEDCQSIEEEGDSLTENTREYIEHAIEKNKAQKAWNAKKQEEGLKLRAEIRESREKREALGFADLKSEAELKAALEEAGIPATPENLSKVSNVLDMSESALEMTDQTKYYVIGQNLVPTVENLYQGKYTVYSGRINVSSDEEFSGYKAQIAEILKNSGLDTEEGWKNARWLFNHELPVNADTLHKMAELDQMAEEFTPERVLSQILFTMSAGLHPKETVLDDRAFIAARDVMQDIQEITDGDIIHVADYLLADPAQKDGKKDARESASGSTAGDAFKRPPAKDIIVNLALYKQVKASTAEKEPEDTGKNAKISTILRGDLSIRERLQITLKRQLEEIRQKMTLQATISMERRGIHVETEALDNVIKELHRMETDYTVKQLEELEEAEAEEKADLLQETMEKTDDISKGFAGVLGTGIRYHKLLTVNELHSAVSSQNLGRKEWADAYETVKTTVREDLGDSIQKAFEGVPAMLEEMGLEDTEANERAVRILGYNNLEITEENIDEVKIFDAKVNQLIDNMKPSTVLELIRRGDNPLNTPLDELNEKLQKINEEKNVTEEEKYSRFLWQLERDGQISEEERSGYIGIYRLLRRIEKSDGVAIGALVESGQEVTLGNLLTQIRIKKGPGIDTLVDDASGTREAVHTRASITDQIRQGFAGNSTQNRDTQERQDGAPEQEKTAYYRQLVSDVVDTISPSKLQEMTDGDMQSLLNTSVEHFAEELKQMDGNTAIKKEYYEKKAEEIREGVKDTEAAEELLSKLSVPETIGNLMAANEVLAGDVNVFKEVYDRRKILPKEREKELDDTIDAFLEAAGSEETMEKNCEQAEKIMQEVLTESYESADINFEELQHLQQIGRGLKLQVAFRKSRSYEIPIRTGDTITSLNLTIIRGADETGKVQISMEDETFGSISLDFKVTGEGSVKGLVLCSERQGFEALRSQQETWEEGIQDAGFSVKNISYGMDFKSRNELLDESSEATGTDTAKLYQLSKVLVRQITNALRK